MGWVMAGTDQFKKEHATKEYAKKEHAKKEHAKKEHDGDWAEYLPAVILSNPQMGENIGASARAMKNCGLSTMHIVNPRDGWPNPAAVSMAASGGDVLDHAQLHDTTRQAAEPYTLIAATTARRRGMIKDILSPRDAAQRLIDHARAGGKPALLFGAERSGLDNDEIALADIIITVPLNPQFPSLNLGQAVLLMGWECRMAAMEKALQTTDQDQSSEVLSARSEDKQFFYDTLEDSLDKGGFFATADMQPGVMRNIMAMFGRADLTEQDIRTLHGMIKAIKRSGVDQGKT